MILSCVPKLLYVCMYIPIYPAVFRLYVCRWYESRLIQDVFGLHCFCVTSSRSWRHNGRFSGFVWSRKWGAQCGPSTRLRLRNSRSPATWPPAGHHYPCATVSLLSRRRSSGKSHASSHAVPPVAVRPAPSGREWQWPAVTVARSWWRHRVSVGGHCVPASWLSCGGEQGSPPAGTLRPRPEGLPGRSPSDGSLLLPEAAICGVHETSGRVTEGVDWDATAQ